MTMLAMTLFMPAVLNDGDSFSHVATGNWMIAHRSVPHADPFSFSSAGAPWVSHEWLSELLMAAAFRAAGWSGVIVLTALAASLAFFNLARHLQRWLPTNQCLLLLLLAAACVAPELLARPHILALPALEAWIAGLFLARSQGRAPPWTLLPLMCLWANMHGSFMIGLFLVGPLALEAMLADPGQWRSTIMKWGRFFAGSLGAALLTPHGLTGVTFPLQFLGLSELSQITEWQPTNFATLQPLELVLAVGLYVSLTRGARLPILRLAMLIGLLHIALQHTRQQMLVGIIAPLLIAGPLGNFSSPAHRLPRLWRSGAVAVVFGVIAVRLLLPIARVDGPTAPMTALTHVPVTMRRTPLFNDYNFGGYLIYAGVSPFIDGRQDMYGDEFMRQYAAVTHPDKAALEKTFRDYDIQWTLLSPSNAAVSLLDALPGWCRLYADAFAIIHTRACEPGER
jgi:hypothetical protein